MKSCPNCQKPPTFLAVLSAVNPARIRCSYCKQTIIIKTLPAVLATATALILSLIALATVDHFGYGMSIMAIALISLGLLLEAAYFLAIRSGRITSNLN